jgi:IS66 C-terminal element
VPLRDPKIEGERLIRQLTNSAGGLRNLLRRKGVHSKRAQASTIRDDRRQVCRGRATPERALNNGSGEHWAVIASLIETCKLTGIEPHAYLADIITKIVNAHPNSQIDDLLPWASPVAPALRNVV